MHSKNDNMEISMNDEADKVIKERFDSLKYSEFVFDYVHLLDYKRHKINPNCGGSYIDSPDRKKKQTSNKNQSYQ